MLTQKDVKLMIERLRESTLVARNQLRVPPNHWDTTEIKKRKKAVVDNLKTMLWLRKVKLYLETNPTEEFIVKQQKHVEKVLESIEVEFNAQYSHITDDNIVKKLKQQDRAAFFRKKNKKKLTEQLRMLNFLLQGSEVGA